MNNYVTLDTYKYMCPGGEWEQVTRKPATARYLLSGSLDVSYGPGPFKEWRGVIIVPVSAASGWGTKTTFDATLQQTQGLSFTDHYGTSYTVHLFGDFQYRSLMNMWDSASNEFRIPVRLVAE